MTKQNNTTDKLTDKAFSRMMLTSVIGILVCIMCLCSATWAWFSTDISAGNNVLTSGQFDLDVTVTDTENIILTATEEFAKKTEFDLSKGKYTVTLTMTDDTTVSKGFCIITVATSVGTVTYHTASIRKASEDNLGTDPFTFILDVQDENAAVSVTFVPAWGLPAEYDVEQNGTLVITSSVDSGEDENSESENNGGEAVDTPSDSNSENEGSESEDEAPENDEGSTDGEAVDNNGTA